MKSVTLFTLLFFINVIGSAQNKTFTDSRDGNVYPMIEIGDLYWLGSNLRYQTATSWCAQQIEGSHCAQTNYYYYTDLDSVCPTGWRVPTWEDWSDAVDIFMQKSGIQPDQMQLDSSDLNRASIIVQGINLYDDTLGLNLKSVGWIEGDKAEKSKKLEKRPAATFWLNEPGTNDPTTHVHVGWSQYNKHGHDHHVIDKPKLTRRFTVRCVKNK
jgi:uncharacterized protein (TIGR02145 family)